MNPDRDPVLAELVSTLVTALGEDLVAVVLFGSASEDRRRAVSDTNIVVVLARFDPAQVAAVRDVLRPVRIALSARFMILCRDEIPAAASAFAVKFADILRRRRVIHGSDPFAGMTSPRPAAIAQLRQALLNLVLRLREGWIAAGDDGELARIAAEAAGGLRACAAELIALEGLPALAPREALESVAGAPLPELSAARDGSLATTAGPQLAQHLLQLAGTMRGRAERLA